MGLRSVVVIGGDQKHYIGKVEDEELVKLKEMQPVALREAYQIVIIDQQMVDQVTGQTAGLSRSYLLMNIGTAVGALPELNIKPVGWYDPKTCEVDENMERLIKQAEEAGAKARERRGPAIVRAGAGALSALGNNGPSIKEIIGNNNKR